MLKVKLKRLLNVNNIKALSIVLILFCILLSSTSLSFAEKGNKFLTESPKDEEYFNDLRNNNKEKQEGGGSRSIIGDFFNAVLTIELDDGSIINETSVSKDKRAQINNDIYNKKASKTFDFIRGQIGTSIFSKENSIMNIYKSGNLSNIRDFALKSPGNYPGNESRKSNLLLFFSNSSKAISFSLSVNFNPSPGFPKTLSPIRSRFNIFKASNLSSFLTFDFIIFIINSQINYNLSLFLIQFY